METEAVTILTNIGNFINESIGMIGTPFYVAGIACMFSGLIMMTTSKEGAFGKGIMLIFIAGILAGLPTFIAQLGNTLLNISDTKVGALSFSNGGNEQAGVRKAAAFAMFTIIRITGIVAIYKGLNRFKFYNMSPNGDPRLVSEGFTLITMGGFAVFAKEFLTALAITLSGTGGRIYKTLMEFIG